jgi:hypothetical protein
MLNIQERAFQIHRSVDGTPVAADANLAAVVTDWGRAIQTAGFDSILVGVTLTGGAAPTVDIKPVMYDGATNAWAGTEIMLVNSGELYEIETHNQQVYIMIAGVAGNPTNVTLQVVGAKRSAWTR